MASIQVYRNSNISFYSNKFPIVILNFDNSAKRNSTWPTSERTETSIYFWFDLQPLCNAKNVLPTWMQNSLWRQSRIDPCLVTLKNDKKRFPVDAFGSCVTPKSLLFPFCLQVCVRLASSRSQPYLVQFRNSKRSLKNCEITHCWCLL